MENIENIKRKIKKLFALSASSNPNEAAAALQKAQTIMREYSINMSAADLLNFERVEVKTGSRGRHAPPHESRLMKAVAEAFGCRRAYGYTDGEGFYKVHDFIGPKHRVQIASYIATVLLRKLRRERAAYIKSLYRVRKRYTKVCRADEFCSGWVCGVCGKLAAAKVNPEEEKALDDYERSLGWTGRKMASPRSSKNDNDWGSGYRSGKNVEIRGGVGAFSERPSIGAPL
ncbi:MAG: DUF2786 domain-containing protein [Treponema sp.]|jgi:hypothetical protein|nr:DUF2786 domain-containing protein [Treponema sp.]